jgi:hypothetical protein
MKIHLGKSYSETMPAGALNPDQERFPTFHIEESDHKGLGKIPDSGKATIKFKVRDRHTHERAEGEEKSKGISLTIEIHSFEVEPRREKPKGNSDARDAFKKWSDEEDEKD